MIAATTRCLPSMTTRRVPARVGVVRFPQRPAAVTSAAGAASPGGNGSTSPRPARAQALARPFDAPLPVAALLDDKAAAAEALRAGYYRLFRGWNALPSLCLVLLGAWTGAGKTVLALQHLTVWFMGAASACVALASCAINDYFDWKIDAVNDASKPIPSGLITPDRALLVSASAYICLLALTCVVPNTGVRLIIAASAAATLLYTPLIKRHLLAKNLVVASTIAVAPLAGALAAGAAGPGLRAVLAPSAFLFLGIMHREIMMDIQDRQGDAEAGVRTLPVVLGPHAALGTCAGLLAACAVLAAHSALLGTGLSWAWAANASLEAPLRAAMLAAVAGVMYGPAAAVLRVLRSSFDRGEVASAVSKSMGSIAAGTLLLALLV